MDSIAAERQRIQEEIARLQRQDAELLQKELDLTRNSNNSNKNFWKRDKVALTSYPRSGNSFLRKIIEQLTGTTTGSDGNPERSLNKQLQELGMKGEGKMDSSEVWCVKTHYPERVGRARLTASRFIVLVRNPFDCILSFFQMMVTDSHSKSISKQELDEKYATLWNDFLLEEVSIWIQFHAHWRQVQEQNPNLCLLLRYEDLIDNARRDLEIERLAKFLYRDIQPEHETMALLKRYQTAQLEVNIYPQKPTSTARLSKLVKSTEFYTNEQYLHVLASTRSDLVRLEYWNEACMEWERRSGGEKLDSVPYVDKLVGDCIVVKSHSEAERFWLNSKYALRPRTKEDPYGRGFDVRWEFRLEEIRGPTMTIQ